MTVKSKLWALCCAAWLVCPAAMATDLLQSYHDSLKNDPTFRAAHSTYLSALEQVPQARANLLPGLLGTARLVRTNTFQRLAGFTLPPTYASSHEYIVSLTQPVFDMAAVAGLKQAKASVKAAAATYFAEAQALMLRVSTAYFNVLEAKDNVRFTIAEKKANKQQLEQAQQRFKVGLDAITSVYDAQAAYDGTVAAEIGTKNDVKNARESLREITGHYYDKIDPLKVNFPLRKPDPNEVEEWVQTTTKHNFTLIASRYAALASRHQIKASAAERLPVVDVVGEYQNRNPVSGVFTTNDIQSVGLGMTLSFPVYQGGKVFADTRQSQQDYETALANLDGVYKNSVVNTRQFFNNAVSGISQVKADKQAVKSARSSVESNQAGYRVGTRTIVDVLLVQRDLYDRQRIQAQDTYAYINSLLALKDSSGLLNVSDLEEVNTWLESPTAHTTSERFKHELYHSQHRPTNKSPKTRGKHYAVPTARNNISRKQKVLPPSTHGKQAVLDKFGKPIAHPAKQAKRNVTPKVIVKHKTKRSFAYRVGRYSAAHDTVPTHLLPLKPKPHTIHKTHKPKPLLAKSKHKPQRLNAKQHQKKS